MGVTKGEHCTALQAPSFFGFLALAVKTCWVRLLDALKPRGKLTKEMTMHRTVPLKVRHWDLSTVNVLVDGLGLLVLGDFGTAKALDGGPSRHDATALTYSAPEMLLGSIRSNEKADIWAGAIVLTRMALGKAAFKVS